MHAVEIFNRVVRHKEVPADMPVCRCPKASPRMGHPGGQALAKVGLADSVSDAVRKIKAGAVEINGEKVKDLAIANGGRFVIQVGKNWRKIAPLT